MACTQQAHRMQAVPVHKQHGQAGRRGETETGHQIREGTGLMYITRPRAYVATHAVEMDVKPTGKPFSAYSEDELAAAMLGTVNAPKSTKGSMMYRSNQSLRIRDKLLDIIGDGKDSFSICLESPVNTATTRQHLSEMRQRGWVERDDNGPHDASTWLVTEAGRNVERVHTSKKERNRAEKRVKAEQRALEYAAQVLAFATDWKRTTEIAGQFGVNPKTMTARLQGIYKRGMIEMREARIGGRKYYEWKTVK